MGRLMTGECPLYPAVYGLLFMAQKHQHQNHNSLGLNEGAMSVHLFTVYSFSFLMTACVPGKSVTLQACLSALDRILL